MFVNVDHDTTSKVENHTIITQEEEQQREQQRQHDRADDFLRDIAGGDDCQNGEQNHTARYSRQPHRDRTHRSGYRR